MLFLCSPGMYAFVRLAMSLVLLLVYGIITGLDAPCGCFVLNDPDRPFHNGLAPALYRDFVMVLAIGYLYWWRWQRNAAQKT